MRSLFWGYCMLRFFQLKLSTLCRPSKVMNLVWIPVFDVRHAVLSNKCSVVWFLKISYNLLALNYFLVSPQVNIWRIQIWWAWRPWSGSCSIYPSVMIGVIENILQAQLKYAKPSSCILSAITYNLNISKLILIWTFFVFWYMELVPNLYPHLSVTCCIYKRWWKS
jgi:hypothetical protein